MPIKNISDIRRFTRAGKLRLGEKKIAQSGAEYPAKLDYFLADFDNPEIAKQFTALYGMKPKRIQVAFPSEDEAEVFPQWYMMYAASGLKCKGDGETCQRATDTGDLVELECPTPEFCEFCHKKKGDKVSFDCKRIGKLRFFIPDLAALEIVEIDTSSFNSIVNLNSGLEILRKVAGRISFIPVNLDLVPKEAQVRIKDRAGKLQSQKVNIFVLQINIPVSLRNVRGALKPLVDGPVRVALPPPSTAIPDDLYPRSIQAPPKPSEVPEEYCDVDPETGEVLSPEPVAQGTQEEAGAVPRASGPASSLDDYV